jgi:tRNA (guanine37-N1)-methyltransferase
MPETNQKLHISVITLFPDIFEHHLKHLPLSRAISKSLVQVDLINLRDFAVDKRGTVDSPPYGGGPGMILRPEPIYNAVLSAVAHTANKDSVEQNNTDAQKMGDKTPSQTTGDAHSKTKVIFLTPRGTPYNQKVAMDLAHNYSHLIIFCGRYEGMDQRVIDYFVEKSKVDKNLQAEEISMGNYVLSGGEVGAMAIMESVVRLIPGAIDNQEALRDESFNPTRTQNVEHPQYTRPEIWQNIKVPEILLSGHHKNIQTWKQTTV